MLITHAKVYLDGAFVSPMSVRISEGMVQALSADLQPLPGEKVLDLGGDYLLPGFVDVHIHGYKAHDTMEGEASIRAMSRAAMDWQGSQRFIIHSREGSPAKRVMAESFWEKNARTSRSAFPAPSERRNA